MNSISRLRSKKKILVMFHRPNIFPTYWLSEQPTFRPIHILAIGTTIFSAYTLARSEQPTFRPSKLVDPIVADSLDHPTFNLNYCKCETLKDIIDAWLQDQQTNVSRYIITIRPTSMCLKTAVFVQENRWSDEHYFKNNVDYTTYM